MPRIDGWIHIDLSEDGLPDQWVEVDDIGSKSPRQLRQLTALPSSPEDLSQLTDQQAADAGRSFIRLTVRAWSLKDPETGAALPAPDSLDLDPDTIPMVVTGRIRAEVAGRIEEIRDLKARSRNV